MKKSASTEKGKKKKEKRIAKQLRARERYFAKLTPCGLYATKRRETSLPEKKIEMAAVVMDSVHLPYALYPFDRGASFKKQMDIKRKRERPCTPF